MKTSKKLIALICAIAMVFSAFGMFTIANAADEGITLSAELDQTDGKTITIKASYTGYDEGISSYAVKLNIPSELVAAAETGGIKGYAIDADDFMGDPTVGYVLKTDDPDATEDIYTITNAKNSKKVSADKVIATITVKLAAPLAEDYTIALQNETAIDDDDTNLFINADGTGGLEVASVTVEAWNDPNAPTPTPTPTPVATTDVTRPPVKTAPPTEVPATAKPTEVPITKGIQLAGSISDDGLVGTIVATAVGYDAGIESYALKLNIPSELVAAAETGGIKGYAIDGVDTLGDPTVGYVLKADDPEATEDIYTITNAKNSKKTLADNVIATVTIKFKEALAEDLIVTLQNETAIDDGEDNLFISSDPATSCLTPTFAIIPKHEVGGQQTETPATPKPAPTQVPAETKGQTKGVLTDDQVAFIEEADEAGNGVFFVPKFKDKSGNDLVYNVEDHSQDTVVYGEDFVAYWDGEELEQWEFDNVMAGYKPDGSPATGSEIAGSLSFGFYNDGNVGDFTLDVIAETDEGNTIAPGEDYDVDGSDQPSGGATPTPTPPAGTTTPGGTTPGGSKPGSTTPGSAWWWGDTSGSGNTGTIYNAGSTPTQQATPFVDLDDAHAWAIPAIVDLYSKGIIAGRTSTLYDPDAAVTRAEFTKLVVGASGLAPAGTPSFADAAEHWAATWIATAEQYGIVTGYTADTFAPDKTINRQEMAAIVARAAAATGKYLPEGSLSFADQDQIDDYAKAPVASLQAAGIINGVGNNMYAPKENATRAQSAVIVYNYMNK